MSVYSHFNHIIMKITDEKLYALCKKYGRQALLWRRKFIGLLPEVNRRRMFEQKGFSSIFEFAAKLCGLSAEQVSLALNLGKRFEDKPILKAMLERGEASINKLSRVVSIATAENEAELAAKVRVLPISALNVLVHDEKYAQTQVFGEVDGLPKPSFGSKSLYVQTANSGRSEVVVTALNFQIESDVKAELEELNSKGIDVNELLREMLKKRKEEIANKKAEIAREMQVAGTNSRYIPAKIRKIIKEEHGKKCSIHTCHRPARVLHHTQRFALSQNHDPHFISPLCRDHHKIAHSIDLAFGDKMVACTNRSSE